jgi:hypothetical protein
VGRRFAHPNRQGAHSLFLYCRRRLLLPLPLNPRREPRRPSQWPAIAAAAAAAAGFLAMAISPEWLLMEEVRVYPYRPPCYYLFLQLRIRLPAFRCFGDRLFHER